MRRIAITNLKGGVGKTTTAVNLASGLARRLAPQGQRVLLIDLDPQIDASSSSWLGFRETSHDFLDMLVGEGELALLARETYIDGLDIIPGSESLARAEANLSHEPGSEMVLRSLLDQLPPVWEVVLMDLPPNQGWLIHSALTAADDVLLPIESGSMALGSLHGLDRVVKQIRRRLNPQLQLFGALQTRADARTVLHREVDQLLRQQFGDVAFQTIIRTDVKLLEAPGHRQDIFTYAPRSRAAQDYARLADEVGKRLGLDAFASASQEDRPGAAESAPPTEAR